MIRAELANLFSGRHPSAVDHQIHARDEARLVGGEEDGGARHVLGLA